jgi:ribonucleoside-diphosphate reductase alpha chain
MGAFSGYAKNAEPMLRVIGKHRRAAYAVAPEGVSKDLFAAQRAVWDEAFALGSDVRLPEQPGHGARAHRHHRLHDGLRHHRHRAGHRAHQVQEAGRRGMLKIVNNTVPLALQRLGYSTTEAQSIVQSLDQKETIEGAPGLKPSTFRCSTARSSRPRASAASTTSATSG